MESPPRRFNCDFCSKSFSSKPGLDYHTKSHTGEKPFSCKICGTKFRTKGEVKRHKVTHTDRLPEKCEICERTVLYLQRHLERHTRIRAFPCDDCSGSFITSSELAAHKRRAHPFGGTTFECNICSKPFKSPVHVRRHQNRVHLPVGLPHKCDLCDKSYKSVTYLKDHIISHTGERPYKCSECHKSFPTLYRLKMHAKAVHSDERPFSCEVCKKRFTFRTTLVTHSKTHIPFLKRPDLKTCPICKKSVTRARIKTHIQSHHRTRPSRITEKAGLQQTIWHICPFCGRRTAQKDNFYIHLRTHIGELFYSCDICGRRFSRKGTLQTHRLSHSKVKAFKCLICGNAFRTKSQCRGHANIHSSKMFTCLFCGMRSNPLGNHFTHIRTHIGERPHFCRICGRETPSAAARKRHEGTHHKKF